jgi:hypothetical protein
MTGGLWLGGRGKDDGNGKDDGTDGEGTGRPRMLGQTGKVDGTDGEG